MTTHLSWKQVAETLAKRISNHAYCPEPHETGSDINCPYCEDWRAYQLYLEKEEGKIKP